MWMLWPAACVLCHHWPPLWACCATCAAHESTESRLADRHDAIAIVSCAGTATSCPRRSPPRPLPAHSDPPPVPALVAHCPGIHCADTSTIACLSHAVTGCATNGVLVSAASPSKVLRGAIARAASHSPSARHTATGGAQKTALPRTAVAKAPPSQSTLNLHMSPRPCTSHTSSWLREWLGVPLACPPARHATTQSVASAFAMKAPRHPQAPQHRSAPWQLHHLALSPRLVVPVVRAPVPPHRPAPRRPPGVRDRCVHVPHDVCQPGKHVRIACAQRPTQPPVVSVPAVALHLWAFHNNPRCPLFKVGTRYGGSNACSHSARCGLCHSDSSLSAAVRTHAAAGVTER